MGKYRPLYELEELLKYKHILQDTRGTLSTLDMSLLDDDSRKFVERLKSDLIGERDRIIESTANAEFRVLGIA